MYVYIKREEISFFLKSFITLSFLINGNLKLYVVGLIGSISVLVPNWE